MALRVTRQYAGVLGTGDGKARVTRQYVEVLATGDTPKVRVSQQYVEILDSPGPLRVTRQCVAVLGDAPPSGTRVTRQCVAAICERDFDRQVYQFAVEVTGTPPQGGYANVYQYSVEVLGDPPGIYSAGAADTLSVSELAVGVLALQEATDTLGLSEVAGSGGSVWNRAASEWLVLSESAHRVHCGVDTLMMSDAASTDVVRAVVETLTLTESATAEIPRFAVDTLTATEEAIRAAMEFNRAVTESLVLTEANIRGWVTRRRKTESLATTLLDAADYELVKLLHDDLALTEHVWLDRVMNTVDTLSLTEGASASLGLPRVVTEALGLSESHHVLLDVQRWAEDSLSLAEANVAHVCKWAAESLSLTEAVSFEYVRNCIEDLALTEEAERGGSIFKRRRTETLTLTDSANRLRAKSKSALDTLTLSEKAVLLHSAEDSLSLGEAANVDKTRYASDTLALTELAGCQTNHVAGNDDLLSLGEAVTVGFIRAVRGFDNIGLTLKETRAWPGMRRVTASDLIQEVHTDYDPITYEEIITYIGLDEVAAGPKVPGTPYLAADSGLRYLYDHASAIKLGPGEKPVSAHDSLALTELVQKTLVTDLSGDEVQDTLIMSDAAHAVLLSGVTVLTGEAEDTLAFSEDLDLITSWSLAETLTLSEACATTVVRNGLGASDTLELGEAVLYYNALEDYLWVYHPFVGAGPSTNPDPPPTELAGPIPGVTAFTLLYPAVGPFTDTLVLRAPNLGNKDRLQMNRVSRETRGGTLIVYADPIWPKVETLVLNFSGLTWAEVHGLHTFMDAHLGMEIGMLDWEHRFWKGILTKLDDPIVQDGPGCKYSVGFEFEGEMAEYVP